MKKRKKYSKKFKQNADYDLKEARNRLGKRLQQERVPMLREFCVNPRGSGSIDSLLPCDSPFRRKRASKIAPGDLVRLWAPSIDRAVFPATTL